ncbi:hypothetical protein [Phreatobacter sp.]|uniref:hypothetical protein n=1 Tax=Phreatobacter sp. TaxID=1966341 RepID=UPI0022BF1B35|nr:hypothetical protein [Phreatobacter sp.]MCZ8314129.1 hypothetical protein [Phreatobacter sp.]
MQSYQMSASRATDTGLPFCGLPLFDWAASAAPLPPLSVRVLTRRYGLTEPMAAVVAELSGFGGLAHE